MQNALVMAEVLLAVVLVTGASLLVRTVGELRDVDLGFNPEGVMALDILASAEETSAEERAIFYEQLLEQTRALPGVQSASLINRLPLRDGGWQGPVRIDDRLDLQGPNRPNVLYRPISPEAFETLGAELLEGAADALLGRCPAAAVLGRAQPQHPPASRHGPFQLESRHHVAEAVLGHDREDLAHALQVLVGLRNLEQVGELHGGPSVAAAGSECVQAGLQVRQPRVEVREAARGGPTRLGPFAGVAEQSAMEANEAQAETHEETAEAMEEEAEELESRIEELEDAVADGGTIR